jgi:hypothetical protein
LQQRRSAEIHSGVTVPRAAAYVVALLFAGGVAAQSAPKSFAHAIRVRAAAEECVKLSAGESIRYVFESSAPVEFNVHFHRGDSVEYPVKRDSVAQADERFTARSTEEYCLMWTNRSLQIVTVKGTLSP